MSQRNRKLTAEGRTSSEASRSGAPCAKEVSRHPMVFNLALIIRRGVISCAGMGVALALPWMESMPLFGQTATAVRSNTPPLRLGIVFFSNGVEPIHWWAKGSRRHDGAGPGGAADDAASRRHGLHSGPLQQAGVRLDQPASRPHERAVGRARQSWTRSVIRVGHLDGPGPRRAASATTRRYPAWCSASSPTSSDSKTACR